MIEGRGRVMLKLLVYVLLSATGLTIIKIGISKGATLLFTKTGLSLAVNWVLLVGMLLYVVSFLCSMVAMKSMNLSVFYPVSAGLIYIVVLILSVIVLREKISAIQLIGMIIIFVGIVVVNIGRK